jgi:pilus assembly protein CpaB
VKSRHRRRRALLFLSLALASGGLAASQVGGRVREVEARVGPQVPVVVAGRELPAGGELRDDVLATRQVPQRFVPPDALASPADARGRRTAVPVAAGSYLTSGELEGAGKGTRGETLGAGQRAVEIAVAGGEALSQLGGSGARVDVLVSTARGDSSGRTFLALEDVELLDLRQGGAGGAGGDSEGAASKATATATLRVTLRQAVYLTAAQNFAREVRLLPRPPGDRGRAGRTAVGAGDL